jgi:biotin carboxyl carrier protein
LQVAVGDRVNEGAWLLSLEAMKIEHRVVAPAAARIAAVHVSSGTLVRAGQVLLDLDLPGPG